MKDISLSEISHIISGELTDTESKNDNRAELQKK